MKALTEQEVSALKTQGWDLLDTTFDITYKSRWGMWHAIREFVQNALDEHDEVGILQPPRLGKTPAGLVIQDEGRGLGARALLMRETKSGTKDLRGQFGEGLKLACITSLREGYNVELRSPHFTIRPILRERTVAGETFHLVSFLFKNMPGTPAGTMVLIEGYQGPDYRDRVYNQVQRNSIRVRSSTIGRFVRYFAIIRDPPNRLYAGDIYVRDLGTGDKASPYSYNLWGLRLNPDRDAEVDASRLSQLIAWTWIRAGEEDIVPLLKQVESNKGYEAQMAWDYVQVSEDRDALSVWVNAWNKVFGSSAVIWTSEEWGKYAQAYGYQPVHLPYSFANFLSDVIDSDEQAVTRRVGKTGAWRKALADSDLSDNERQSLTAARDIAKMILKRARTKDVVMVVAADFSKDPSTGATLEGLWQATSLTVSLRRDVLRDFKRTLEVLLHEMGHWLSGAADFTREHVEGVTTVAFYALEAQAALSGGTGTEKLREPVTVSAGVVHQVAKEMGWADLAAKARAAGIPDPEHWSKATLRKMLNL